MIFPLEHADTLNKAFHAVASATKRFTDAGFKEIKVDLPPHSPLDSIVNSCSSLSDTAVTRRKTAGQKSASQGASTMLLAMARLSLHLLSVTSGKSVPPHYPSRNKINEDT